jgi:hypothetical protein
MSYRRRYYKRPYYYRRSRYRRSNPSLGGIAVLGVVALFCFYALYNGTGAALSALLGWAVLIGIIALIVIGIRKLFGWSGKASTPDMAHIGQQDAAQINSEKHGCKCYMEGLSYGEQEVADTLSRELSYKDYFIFNNLILPSENNGSTQIDHIVVSRFGIFVIESKDYKGWIFGDKDEQQWTQSLPGGKNKFQFQNPIHQNYAHIMALKTLMPFAVDNFYSIVVFSSQSEIKTAPIENVVHLSQLIGCIKKYTQEKLSENDIQLIIGKLSYACQTVDITASEHVANLHAHQLV